MTVAHPRDPLVGSPAGPTRGVALSGGALATVLVGASFPVTAALLAYPALTGQGLRYLAGGLLLIGWAVLSRRERPDVPGRGEPRRGALPAGATALPCPALRRRAQLPRPALRDLPGLFGVAAFGMIGFNLCLLAAERSAAPGFVAGVVGACPVLLAVLGPLADGRRPRPLVMLGALLVAAGIGLVSGGGAWDGPGLGYAMLALVGEAGFTLCAVGVVRRIGALAMSAWACLIAGAGGLVLGALVDGVAGWRQPSGTELAALLALAVLVTAVAFVGWFSCVAALGADGSGVLIGLMPVAGWTISILLGSEAPSWWAAGGIALVAIGCSVGLTGPGILRTVAQLGRPLRRVARPVRAPR